LLFLSVCLPLEAIDPSEPTLAFWASRLDGYTPNALLARIICPEVGMLTYEFVSLFFRVPLIGLCLLLLNVPLTWLWLLEF